MNKELEKAVNGIFETFSKEWNLNKESLRTALTLKEGILGEGSKWTLKAYYDGKGNVYRVIEEQVFFGDFWEAE